MRAPDFPIDETHRTDALDSLCLLDTAPEPDFDRIVRLGRALFGVRTCLVSLVDRDRQWFKARAGLDAEQTPRDISFCGHAILTPDVLVVRNALEDERFHDNPLVTGPPDIRFYAGAPLRLPNGYTIGTLCIIDPTPRPDFGPDQVGLLEDLAGMALTAITVRALRRDLDTERSRGMQLIRTLDIMASPAAVLDPDGTIRVCNAAFAAFCDAYPAAGVPVTEVLPIERTALAPFAFAAEGIMELQLPGGGNRSVTLQLDPDGFILLGAGDPPPRDDDADDGFDLSAYGLA